MLDTYIRLESQNVLLNAALHLDGAPPHVTRAIPSFLEVRFSNLWIGEYGPPGFPATSFALFPPHFFLRIPEESNLSDFDA